MADTDETAKTAAAKVAAEQTKAAESDALIPAKTATDARVAEQAKVIVTTTMTAATDAKVAEQAKTNDAPPAKSAADAKVSAEQAKAAETNARVSAVKAAEAAETAMTAQANAKRSTLALSIIGILTTVSVLAAIYVSSKLIALDPANAEKSGRLLVTVLVCFLGMGFACLGFGLFVVGASGAFKGSTTGKSVVNVDTAAPGLVVMVCATVVIYLALDASKPPTPISKDVSAGSAQPGTGSSEPPGGRGSANNSGSAGSGSGSQGSGQ